MFDHVGTGTGRDNDIPVRFFEDADRMFHNRTRLRPQAGVEGRLSAAGLIAWKLHGETHAAENAEDGFSRLGVERIDQAGDEKLHRRHESIVI